MDFNPYAPGAHAAPACRDRRRWPAVLAFPAGMLAWEAIRLLLGFGLAPQFGEAHWLGPPVLAGATLGAFALATGWVCRGGLWTQWLLFLAGVGTMVLALGVLDYTDSLVFAAKRLHRPPFLTGAATSLIALFLVGPVRR